MEKIFNFKDDPFEEWNLEEENLELPVKNQINHTYTFVNNLILDKGKWNSDDFKIKLKNNQKVCSPSKIKMK